MTVARAICWALLALAPCVGAAAAETGEGRVWEVNGIRLEPAQVERLATDIARQTVVAVERLEGLTLRGDQPAALERIYFDVALDVYDDAVGEVNREDLGDDAKEARVKDLVIAGQERSSQRVASVLDADQYAVYRAWELRQVEAFRRRGLWSGRRSRRGGR